MKKLLLPPTKFRHLVTLLFMLLFGSIEFYGATKYLYVGETYKMETPSPASSNGYIDKAYLLSSANRLYVDVSDPFNVRITVLDYFSNTVTVKVRFVERYTNINGKTDKLDHDVEVIIGAKYPIITIPNGNDEITVKVGQKGKLKYKVSPSDLLEPPMNFGINPYNVPKVSWGSGDAYYNEQTGEGYLEITAKGEGINLIFSLPYNNNKMALVWKVNITNGDDTQKKLDLKASPSGGEVEKGTKVTLATKVDGSTVFDADIYYTLNGNTPTKNSTKYTSSGITINETCTLKAKAYKDGYEDSDVLSVTYTIKNTEPTSITVSPSSKTIKEGESFTASYTLTPSNATTTVKWTSDDKTIATVNESTGKVTGVKAGSTYINATTSNGKSAYCKVTVEQNTVAPTSITVSPSSKTIKEGESFTASYTLTPSNATTTVKWTSDDKTIATVNESTGKVTGVKAGSTYINATTSNGKSAYCKVTVEQNTVAPTSITVSPSSKTIKEGESFTASYTLTPSNATTTVKWTSDDKTIATVNESTGKVTGVKAGSTYINATTSNGKSAYCKVTVEGKGPEYVINATNFPDANFRAYLLGEYYGKDGKLTSDEISKITTIYVYNKNISSLKGIEYFTALTKLYCYNNQLSALDVSKNTALTELHCYNNQLSALDVSKNTALTELGCSDNQLSALDVSKNTALTYLSCSSNQLSALDVSKNTALTRLYCQNNQLSALDVSKNTALTHLYCQNNQLSALDASKNTALTQLSCEKNQLSALDVSKNTALTSLSCYDNQLSALDVSKNTALTSLSCSSTQLTSLDVSKNVLLTWLGCSSNQLQLLDISHNTALTSLECGSNQLTSLDVSKNVALKSIGCSSNQIKGKEMDNLIKSLPVNKTNELYDLRVARETGKGNICTKAQVAAAKSKGWTPCYYNQSQRAWVEYEGYDDSPTAISLPVTETVSVGETITLTPTITPTDANTALKWESDDISIAKVSQSGVVMGLKEGTVIISVTTSNSLKAECFVTVKDPTGITDIKAGDDTESLIYDLFGRRLNQPRKGINIINGKKVVVK